MPNIRRLLNFLCRCSILSASAGVALSTSAADGKIGIIGDSMAAGTHSYDVCGRRDIVECLEELGGFQDREWSYAGGEFSWSIASRLGFLPSQVVDASDDGEEWKDAPDQAAVILQDPDVNTVFIGLGANDICKTTGYDYGGDLERLSGHIDATLQALTDRLPSGSAIYWTEALDVSRLYDLMGARDHNLIFESCQATWDLDSNKVKDGAASSACDHFFANDACRFADSNEEAKDLLIGLFLDSLLESLDVEEGPCGKLLNSDATDQDRQEARQFTQDLNRLMAEKAEAFSGRNGVRIFYSDRLFRSMENLRPEHVSHFDCFHPSRAGQVFLADQVWHGFNSNRAYAHEILREDFNEQRYCPEGEPDSPDCWVEINDDDDPTSGDVRIGDQRLRLSNSDTGIERPLPLGGATRAWLSFNWARRNLEQMADFVTFDVSPDGGASWVELDRFQGDANDYGLHQGDYYDISEYASEETLVRFRTAVGFGSNDRLLVDNVGLIAWNDDPEIARNETPAAGSVQSGVGLIRGWACEAESVAISIDGGELIPIAQGTQRGDTSGVCGDDDNGYGMVLAWGLLGSGTHELRTFVDGADLGSVDFEVATIGDGFVKGLEGEYELADFPTSDESVRVTWSEADQNFLVTGYDMGGGFGDVGLGFGDTPGNGTFPDAAASVGGARHESPAHRSIQSGVGLIRGWACDAQAVEISIDGGALIPVAYGTSRGDTESVCDDADNGYGMVFAWGLLGNGVHRLQTFVNGVEIADVEFEVVAIGDGFVRGLEGTYNLPGFPAAGESVDIRWSEPDQNFRMFRYNR